MTTAERVQTPDPMETISMESVLTAIAGMKFPDVDAVIGIERGGLVPAALVAASIRTPLGNICLRYRDDLNQVVHDVPQILGSVSIPLENLRKILLVDDVSVTGATLRTAGAALEGVEVTTFALIGQADLVAFPKVEGCVLWPWRNESAPRLSTTDHRNRSPRGHLPSSGSE